MNNQPPCPPLHDLEAQRGYLDGLAGQPQTDEHCRASYLRGWHNGDAERGQQLEGPQAEAIRRMAGVRGDAAALHQHARDVLAGVEVVAENGGRAAVRLPKASP